MYSEIEYGLHSIVPDVVSSDNQFKIFIVHICLIFSNLIILFLYLVFGFAEIGILFLNFCEKCWVRNIGMCKYTLCLWLLCISMSTILDNRGIPS
jgi:hypothetical protein